MKFKLAINAARFPFLAANASRSVAQAGLDVAPRTSVAFVGATERFDYNLIQLVYLENVLPVAEGLRSVATQEDIPAILPAVSDFDQLITLRDDQERNFLFCPGRGKNYVYDVAAGVWVSRNPFSWPATRTAVTAAYVNGRTFICYEGDRLIEFDPGTNTFNTRVLTLPSGYTMADVRGIAGVSNYLVLYTNIELMWSSALDLLNFNDPLGKSGKQIPIDVKGQITSVKPISGGAIIYTNKNAVAAFFTNSADTPFSFREVSNSGGVPSGEQITGDANQSDHYTYGSAGIQKVNLQRAVSLFPDCTDFLAGRRYEQWNSATSQLDTVQELYGLDVKLQFLGSRYLVISYGIQDGQYQFALLYDEVLNSWGKVRVPHVDVSVLPTAVMSTLPLRYYELTASYSAYTMAYDELLRVFGTALPIRSGFCFLQKSGAVRTLLANGEGTQGDGVFIAGHVQVTRERLVTFKAAVIDGLDATPAPTVKLIGSLPGNGYDRNSVVDPYWYVADSTARMQQYLGNTVFENFDIAVVGSFLVTNLVVEVASHGSR